MGGVVVPPIFQIAQNELKYIPNSPKRAKPYDGKKVQAQKMYVHFRICTDKKYFFADEDEKAPQKRKPDIRHINAHQKINLGSFVFGVSRSGSFIYIRRSRTTASPPAVLAELFHVLKLCKPKKPHTRPKGSECGAYFNGSSHSLRADATLTIKS